MKEYYLTRLRPTHKWMTRTHAVSVGENIGPYGTWEAAKAGRDQHNAQIEAAKTKKPRGGSTPGRAKKSKSKAGPKAMLSARVLPETLAILAAYARSNGKFGAKTELIERALRIVGPALSSGGGADARARRLACEALSESIQILDEDAEAIFDTPEAELGSLLRRMLDELQAHGAKPARTKNRLSEFVGMAKDWPGDPKTDLKILRE